MLQIQGLGPKKVKILFEKLQIIGVDELERAAREGGWRRWRALVERAKRTS